MHNEVAVIMHNDVAVTNVFNLVQSLQNNICMAYVMVLCTKQHKKPVCSRRPLFTSSVIAAETSEPQFMPLDSKDVEPGV